MTSTQDVLVIGGGIIGCACAYELSKRGTSVTLLDAYLATTPAAVQRRTLADLIAFNAGEPRETALFGQEIFEAAQAKPPITDPGYIEKRATASTSRPSSVSCTGGGGTSIGAVAACSSCRPGGSSGAARSTGGAPGTRPAAPRCTH